MTMPPSAKTSSLADDEFSIPIKDARSIAGATSGASDGSEDEASKPQQPVILDAMAPVLAIDLNAISANYSAISKMGTHCSVAPVVKCDGYGLGAGIIARHLLENDSAAVFFVANAKEGAQLRNDLGEADAEIFILNGPGETTLSVFETYRLTPILNSVQQATLWAQAFPDVPTALHVDTGMNRLGLSPEKIIALKSISDLNITLVMSHLAHAGDGDSAVNPRQRAKFLSAATQFPGARLSLSASGGAFIHPSYHYSIIRLGISLYGYTVSGKPEPQLTPCASLTAPIVQMREVKRGESVGYDGTWTAPRTSRIATLAIGYGDGLPRSLSNQGHVAIGRELFPIVGRISMDLTTIDVSDAPSGLAIGDRAEIFGKNRKIEDLAVDAGTISYEILTSVSPRVQRRYIGLSNETS